MTIHIRETQPDDLKPLMALMHDYVVGFYNNPGLVINPSSF